MVGYRRRLLMIITTTTTTLFSSVIRLLIIVGLRLIITRRLCFFVSDSEESINSKNGHAETGSSILSFMETLKKTGLDTFVMSFHSSSTSDFVYLLAFN